MSLVVHLDAAGVSLGGRPVLRDIDLSVDRGETVGIAGPNGSGKTTLVRVAATLTSIDSGRATVLDTELGNGDLTSIRRRIGLIGHQPSLIPELSLAENLTHVARLGGIDPTRVGRALEVVGLGGAADRRARACSFGMQRRVEIAHLLLTRPDLLLLDEAGSGLDDSARDLIVALVRSVGDRGGGCIVVSHDRSQLTALTDRTMTLSDGRLEVTT
ncbi:MAG: ABC transporter ATP-binding protein [Acidimicrobiia bacterium]